MSGRIALVFMIETNKIYNEDCLQTIRHMEDESVDLIITSPPYNLGNDHHTGSKRHNPYNDDMSETEYQAWQTKVMCQIYRILKNEGWLFYNHKNRIKAGKMITPYEWILKTPFILRQEITWFGGSQNMDKCRFFPMTERLYCLAKGNAKMQNNLNLTDDWHISPVGINEEHARAFPERLVSNIMACVEFKTVYDPFCGSGTTLVMAEKSGKNWIGSEINKKYFDVANKRIAEEQAKMPLPFPGAFYQSSEGTK